MIISKFLKNIVLKKFYLYCKKIYRYYKLYKKALDNNVTDR